jgi:N-acetylglucosamine-6-phosphate deacetylase
MIVLSGAELVLPDRILSRGTLVIDGDRIAEIRPEAQAAGGHSPSPFAFHNHYIVPGFIDVHVHGVEGIDSLDSCESIVQMAACMPRFGVTAFCPTTVACSPDGLRRVLEQVARARAAPEAGSARVLAAHLESNFINAEFRGAQPAGCLRCPQAALDEPSVWAGRGGKAGEERRPRGGAGEAGEAGGAGEVEFTASDVLAEIARAEADVGIVTLAPELDGALELIRWLSARGHRISLGHSGAAYDNAMSAIQAGARQATHLFNCMPPLHHRAPGLAGAVLQAEEIAAELICDGVHVHPAMLRTAIAAKGPSRMMAITDGTAASGLAVGSHSSLGGQSIVATDSGARLADGTLAGSVMTMDGAFRTLVDRVGVSLVDAAIMCSTTPARELALVGHGVLAEGAFADVVILDSQLKVVQTYVGGQLVSSRRSGDGS